MIPIWHECPDFVAELKKSHCYAVESCVLCGSPSKTWHENTNNPICLGCASTCKVSDIPKDYGQYVRRDKRNGTFDRGRSVRAN